MLRYEQNGGALQVLNKRTRTIPGRTFEETTLLHLDAAYNLARWLMGNTQDAEDMVQEAYLRAFKAFDGYHGGDSRAWLLTIVRNTCYTWLQRNHTAAFNVEFDEDRYQADCETGSPERLFLEKVDRETLRQAMDELPVEFREVIVLRELEDLSYKEIALIARVPLGTVMSRLARARQRLQKSLSHALNKEQL